MLELLLAGLGTRSYGKAIGEMAETAGVSKSSVSRQAAEAAGERLKELAERRLDDRDYLIVYVDGIQFGGHHVLAALGVDDKGNKRVLGLREGASENAVVALALLESLVERGLDPGRARLFVLDGSKALHKAVGQVFGSACLVQRCRNHKMRNVTGHLPKELHDQASAVLRAAWKLGAKDGKARIEQFASWVEKQHPDAAGSLREGLGEMFTVREDRTDPGAPAVPGHDQRDRQRSLGDAPPHRPGDPVERRVHGGALGGRRVSGRREELPQDHGLQGPLDTQGAPGRARHSPG